MATLVENTETIQNQTIPDYLVYEVMDGKPIYYKGWQEVLANNKIIDDIMGASDIQAIIIDCIVEYFYFQKFQGNKRLSVLYSELGLHVNTNNNFAADIAVYESLVLATHKYTGNYMSIPPKITIEVDTKADLNNFDSTMNYFEQKTKKLLEFGVEKVIWILTKHHKVIEMTAPYSKWIIYNWDNEIEIADDYHFSIANLLKERGIELEV